MKRRRNIMFKKGDRVKVISINMYDKDYGLHIGHVSTILHSSERISFISFKDGYYVNNNQIRLIKRKFPPTVNKIMRAFHDTKKKSQFDDILHGGIKTDIGKWETLFKKKIERMFE